MAAAEQIRNWAGPRRRWITLMALATLVAVVWGAWGGLFQNSKLHEIRAERLALRCKASGEIRSTQPVNISPPAIPDQWRFTITDMAPEGKAIQAGAPVIEFDTKVSRDRLQLLRSQLAEQEKELEKSVLEEQERLDQLTLLAADADRQLSKETRKLEVPPELLSRGELDANRLDKAFAEDQARLGNRQVEIQREYLAARTKALSTKVQRLRQQVATTEDGIRRMSIVAPESGYVVYLSDYGEKPQAGRDVWYGQPIIQIAPPKGLMVAAMIFEPDARLVRVGQGAEIRLAANPDRLFHGRIRSLGRVFRPKGENSPSVIFDAEIALLDPDDKIMRPGMAVDISIVAETETPVVAVPEDSVVLCDGQTAVEMAQGERRPVVLGRRSTPLIEVVKGLAPGEKVRLSPKRPATEEKR